MLLLSHNDLAQAWKQVGGCAKRIERDANAQLDPLFLAAEHGVRRGSHATQRRRSCSGGGMSAVRRSKRVCCACCCSLCDERMQRTGCTCLCLLLLAVRLRRWRGPPSRVGVSNMLFARCDRV
jgi:hypothetical protein